MGERPWIHALRGFAVPERSWRFDTHGASLRGWVYAATQGVALQGDRYA